MTTTFTPPIPKDVTHINVDDGTGPKEMVHIHGDWYLLTDLESGRIQLGHPSDWYKSITFSPQAWEAIWKGKR